MVRYNYQNAIQFPNFMLWTDLPEVDAVTPDDVELALRNTRPSAHLHAHRYEQFNQDYGSHVLNWAEDL